MLSWKDVFTADVNHCRGHPSLWRCHGLQCRVPRYVRGRTKIITTAKEHMSYVEVKKVIGEMCLRYKEVDRMWYVEHNSTLSDGLHRILTNQDVVDGLFCTSENKWFMTIYFEGKFDHDYGADNEDLYVGRNEEDPHLDSMTADSVAPEFVHLVDDDNRTTDDEFEEALYHMGIHRTRRRVAYMDYSSGEEDEEVDQQQASVIGLAGQGEEVDQQFGPHEPTNDLGHEDQPEGILHGSESLSEDASEYRKSEDSDHVRGNISEDEAIEDIYDGAPKYDPDCDHMTLKFTLGMKFASPSQFKHAVVKHAIYQGANLKWIRGGENS
ncbi:hypothetical protein LINPERHAP1_LOCUS14697 [Linum perenne]